MKKLNIERLLCRVKNLREKSDEVVGLFTHSPNEKFLWKNLIDFPNKLKELDEKIKKTSNDDKEELKKIEEEVSNLEIEVKDVHQLVEDTKRHIKKLMKEKLGLSDYSIRQRRKEFEENLRRDVEEEKKENVEISRKSSFDWTTDQEKLKQIWTSQPSTNQKRKNESPKPQTAQSLSIWNSFSVNNNYYN